MHRFTSSRVEIATGIPWYSMVSVNCKGGREPRDFRPAFAFGLGCPWALSISSYDDNVSHAGAQEQSPSKRRFCSGRMRTSSQSKIHSFVFAHTPWLGKSCLAQITCKLQVWHEALPKHPGGLQSVFASRFGWTTRAIARPSPPDFFFFFLSKCIYIFISTSRSSSATLASTVHVREGRTGHTWLRDWPKTLYNIKLTEDRRHSRGQRKAMELHGSALSLVCVELLWLHQAPNVQALSWQRSYLGIYMRLSMFQNESWGAIPI